MNMTMEDHTVNTEIENTELLVFQDEGGTDYLCLSNITVANSLFSQIRGRMFTRSIGKDYCIIFPQPEIVKIDIHMLFVPYKLGVVWLNEGEVVQKKVLSPWVGYHTQRADMVMEMHPEHLSNISIGDTVHFLETNDSEITTAEDSTATETQEVHYHSQSNPLN